MPPPACCPACAALAAAAGYLQLTTALFILLASLSTPRVWSALTLRDSAITPVGDITKQVTS